VPQAPARAQPLPRRAPTDPKREARRITSPEQTAVEELWSHATTRGERGDLGERFDERRLEDLSEPDEDGDTEPFKFFDTTLREVSSAADRRQDATDGLV